MTRIFHWLVPGVLMYKGARRVGLLRCKAIGILKRLRVEQMGVETVHVDCGCRIALTCGIWDRERCPQMEINTWSVQIACLVVVEDGVRAPRCRSELVGVVVRKRSEGERIGIKYRGCKSPLVGLAKA